MFRANRESHLPPQPPPHPKQALRLTDKLNQTPTVHISVFLDISLVIMKDLTE
jgi:hypothetical protein